MGENKLPSSRLFITSCVEGKDDIDEKYDRCYSLLQSITSGLTEKEANDALNCAVCKDHKNHEEVSLGLLVVILTEPKNAAKCFRDLTYITRDGLNLVLSHLTQLIIEKYIRLLDVVRQQLIWLIKELIKSYTVGVDAVCWNVMRQIAGGDLSPKNIWLAENMLDIYSENRTWLDKFPFLVASTVYTYLRLIEDHYGQAFAQLRQKEVTFTVTLLQQKFSDCLIIGRDLVRLLQNVARIPEFEQLWRDILFNPKSLCPHFSGVLQLMQSRTSRRFLQSRLTPDMEKKVVFITSQVRFGMQKRYQEWFQRQYLATPESQSLRCDLIRFIVGVIHPTNELLCSDIIPRWAVIGWLLTTCTSNVAASNAKLALFYDWLFFDPEKDNIMNIEPAILVMHHSLRPHPAITATLLDFLCRIITSFYPPLLEKVKAGIFTSLRQILDKRVLPSLSPLLDNPKLDRELKTMIKDTFEEFCAPSPSEVKTADELQPQGLTKEAVPQSPVLESLSVALKTEEELPPANNHTHNEPEPRFSDDDDDIPLSKVRLKEKVRPDLPEQNHEEIDISHQLEQLEGDMKLLVQELQSEKDNEARCEAMEKLVQVIIQESVDGDTAAALGICLCGVLSDHIESNDFPVEVNDETIEDSIGRPLYVMYRNLCQISEEDPSRHPLLNVLAEMHNQEPRIGFRLLHFLRASKICDAKASVYKDFCHALDSKDLGTCLVNDLRLCQESDVRLFCWLLPDIYTWFPNAAIGNTDMLNLIVSCIDSTQLQDLVCQIMQGNMVMFRKDSFLSVLNASLEWETFEQYCLWQLVTAHNIPVDYVLPILPKLEFAAHAEALTSILLMLKQEKPTTDLLKHLMSREVKHQDVFVVSALRYWSQEHEDKLAELISSQFSKLSTSPNKRKRNQTAKSFVGPPVELALSHLDQLRQCCKQTNFFSMDSIQRALQQLQNTCSESQKKKFSDLFALAEVEEVEVKPTSKGGRRKGTNSSKGGKRKAANRDASETSEESSEEEEFVKPKSNKRKKSNLVGSDSD